MFLGKKTSLYKIKENISEFWVKIKNKFQALQNKENNTENMKNKLATEGSMKDNRGNEWKQQ